MSNFIPNQPSAADILNKYESNPKQSVPELWGRKILRFITFGKVALNPELNKTIRQVLALTTPDAFDSDEHIQVLESLVKKAHKEHASLLLKQQLDNTLGALKTKDITPKQMEEKLQESDFLSINNPYDSISFALGTFSLFPVDFHGIKFTCAEAAFQAQKFEDTSIQQQFSHLTGAEAQVLADQLKSKIRKDWPNLAVKAMKEILSARSAQNKEYRDLLLASKYTFLVVHSRNSFWGDGNGKGKNLLGKLLMEEREILGGVGKVPAPPQYFQKYQIATQNEYQVCSYNLGASIDDYMQLLGKVKPNEEEDLNALWKDPKLYQETQTFVAPVRKKLQEEIADFLFDPSKGDIFCLQEVTESNRAFLDLLVSRGFEIIYKVNSKNTVPDCVIALNKAKFKDIQNQSFMADMGSIDVAMATAIDKATGKTVTFVSGHLTAFDLEAEEDKKADLAFQGNSQVKAIVKKVNQMCQESDMVIFGGDFNASPEIHQGRFKPLLDAGYEVYSTGEATNITTKPEYAKKLRKRPLDHFAVRSKLPGHKIEVVKTPKEIVLDPMSNASDHLPIFLKVSETAKKKRF